MIRALVLRTAGTNCDAETLHALKMCGADVDLLHIHRLFKEPRLLSRYAITVIPGGFSYGDDIAAGRILANELRLKLGGEIRQYISQKRLLIGICNGFQVLVKAGFLPGFETEDSAQNTTLGANDSKRFQCEWVALKSEKSKAAWLNAMAIRFELPIAHGEGKFIAKDSKIIKKIESGRQVVFRYFPKNPNGSVNNIAGICNPYGNVVGLMPHPERFVTKYQHPAWSRNNLPDPAPGYLFWKLAVNYAKELS